ncbi:hypothetical protein JTE90_007705 [Oedothorax gibbosus]|uniref:Uncharacterized protein n=1 Tax=Oedothorax gibbosus TaxID=931172 RepID=A0AAV6TLG2_9ARAC|nr:hypothetical protein JTE90_007705 [Oedothorax gibbosus]
MARLGGLTMHRYQIQCDFEAIFDYLEKPPGGDPLPVMKTRTINTFFNLILAFMARRQTPIVETLSDDKAILEQILSDPNSSGHSYHSAVFWGELARQWLNHRRPVPKTLKPLSDKTDNLGRLYDVTCYTRGKSIDPLSMHLIPHSEYVNAVHWKSASQLETFIRVQPEHALSQTVSQLVLKSLHQFLDGSYPSCLAEAKDDKIRIFLKNISVAHETVPKVFVAESPPRLIDVFQRLLAQARYDDLWEKEPIETSVEYPYAQMMHMTEQFTAE